MTSVDIAPEPLALARALASEAGLRCDLRQQDFLCVDDGPYDMACTAAVAPEDDRLPLE